MKLRCWFRTGVIISTQTETLPDYHFFKYSKLRQLTWVEVGP